jgi:hypothetical protein
VTWPPSASSTVQTEILHNPQIFTAGLDPEPRRPPWQKPRVGPRAWPEVRDHPRGHRDALGISVAELAGKPSHRIKMSGVWWSSWQTSRSGEEKIASQQVEIKQEERLAGPGVEAAGDPGEILS